MNGIKKNLNGKLHKMFFCSFGASTLVLLNSIHFALQYVWYITYHALQYSKVIVEENCRIYSYI